MAECEAQVIIEGGKRGFLTWRNDRPKLARHLSFPFCFRRVLQKQNESISNLCSTVNTIQLINVDTKRSKLTFSKLADLKSQINLVAKKKKTI